MQLNLTSVDVICPYCGERLDITIDQSAGAQIYVEDCQVCCRPMDIVIREDSAGDLQIEVRRDDE